MSLTPAPTGTTFTEPSSMERAFSGSSDATQRPSRDPCRRKVALSDDSDSGLDSVMSGMSSASSQSRAFSVASDAMSAFVDTCKRYSPIGEIAQNGLFGVLGLVSFQIQTLRLYS